MKHLQILNAALLALGATLSVVQGVVCLLFGIYWAESASLRVQMPHLLQITGGCLLLAVGAALAFIGQRRQWPGRWLLQVLPAAAIAVMVGILASLRN